MSSRALILHSHEDLEGKPIALLLPALLLLSGMLLLVVGVVLLLLGGMDQPQLDVPGQYKFSSSEKVNSFMHLNVSVFICVDLINKSF